jgi:hypothetical protein
MRFGSRNIIHVRHKGIVHWAELTETLPFARVVLLCEYDELHSYRYLELGTRDRVVRVGETDVDCMACCAEGCLL